MNLFFYWTGLDGPDCECEWRNSTSFRGHVDAVYVCARACVYVCVSVCLVIFRMGVRKELVGRVVAVSRCAELMIKID